MRPFPEFDGIGNAAKGALLFSVSLRILGANWSIGILGKSNLTSVPVD